MSKLFKLVLIGFHFLDSLIAESTPPLPEAMDMINA